MAKQSGEMDDGAAFQALVEAARATHAWFYAEDRGLGSMYQRSVLCSHAEHLTAKALAAVEGKSFDEAYPGVPRLTVWPTCELSRSDAGMANELVRQALALEQHERAAATPEPTP